MLVLYIAGSAGNVVHLRDTEKPIQSSGNPKREPNPRTLFRGRGYAAFYQAREFMQRYAASHGFTLRPVTDRIYGGMFVKGGENE